MHMHDHDCGDGGNTSNGCSIQPMTMLPRGTFMGNKTNTTSRLWLDSTPMTTKLMQLTTSSVITGQKLNKNDLYHYYCNVILVFVCLVL